MRYAIICLDKPDHGHVRAENRPAHLDYLNANLDKIVVAGPMLSDDGERTVGSLLVMEFAGADQARAFADGDPYAKADLFESVAIRPWRQVLP